MRRVICLQGSSAHLHRLTNHLLLDVIIHQGPTQTKELVQENYPTCCTLRFPLQRFPCSKNKQCNGVFTYAIIFVFSLVQNCATISIKADCQENTQAWMQLWSPCINPLKLGLTKRWRADGPDDGPERKRPVGRSSFSDPIRRRVASSLARRLARHLLLTLYADGSLPLWPVVWPVIF